MRAERGRSGRGAAREGGAACCRHMMAAAHHPCARNLPKPRRPRECERTAPAYSSMPAPQRPRRSTRVRRPAPPACREAAPTPGQALRGNLARHAAPRQSAKVRGRREGTVDGPRVGEALFRAQKLSRMEAAQAPHHHCSPTCRARGKVVRYVRARARAPWIAGSDPRATPAASSATQKSAPEKSATTSTPPRAAHGANSVRCASPGAPSCPSVLSPHSSTCSHDPQISCQVRARKFHARCTPRDASLE